MTMRRHTRIALAAAAFAFCYARVLATIVDKWTTSTVYSYGVVVLFVSGYMLWTRRVELRASPAEPDYLFGIPVTLAGVTTLTVGRLALMTSVQEVSLLVTLAGVVLLLFGRAVLTRLWFPLAYLLLGLPIWDVVINRLQPSSQVLSAQLATVFLHGIGMPAFRDGVRVVLPNVTMEVMRECSGVNQVLAIVAIALPAAYLMLHRGLLRVVLLGLAVCVAYLSNGVRITLVGFLAYHGLSSGDLRGMHIAEGLAVSILGYLLLFGCLAALSKLQRAAAQTTDVPSSLSSATPRVWRVGLEVGTLVVVLSIGAFATMFRPADIRLRHDFRGFPTRIGEWTLDTLPAPAALRFPDDDLIPRHPTAAGDVHSSSADDDLIRAYRNAAGDRVQLYVGYHRSQREGNELVGVAGRALNSAAAPVRLEVGSRTIELGQVTRTTSGRQKGMLYWYDLNGRVIENMYSAKGYMVWDALTRGRTNGAVVMIAWEAPGQASADSQGGRALGFAKAVLALLPDYIPS
jgi:EpsI family protein